MAGLLGAADYHRPAHQVVHEAITSLYTRGEPADPIAVAAGLGRRGLLGRVGGVPYLHDLIAAVPVAASAGYYAGIVADRACGRCCCAAVSSSARCAGSH